MTTTKPSFDAQVLKETTILVVDDIPSARNVVVRFLKKLGFTQISEAGDVDDAVTKIASTPFSLVISDVHLKDRSATEILDQVKAKNLPHKASFLIITSDLEKSTFQSVVSSGASTYLLKPFSPQLLAQKIEEAFKAKSQ